MARAVGTSLKAQVNAVVRKNAVYQRRRSCLNCCVIITPIVFIGLLYALQWAIDDALEHRDSRCGCMCVLCCIGKGDDTCREADASSQCDYLEECRRYDDDECGIQYSDSDQIAFCEVQDPVVWPLSISIPHQSDRARAWAPNVVFFIHADDESVERIMQDRMLRDVSVEAANMGIETEQTGEVLGSSGVIFGSSIEPEGRNYIDVIFTEPGLSIIADNCSEGEVQRVMDLINEELPNLVYSFPGEIETGQIEGHPYIAMLFFKGEINRFLYCSWEEAKCNATAEERGIETEISSFQEERDWFGQAFDFKSTDQRALDVDFWIADSVSDGGSGDEERVPAVMNMISDAWMKYSLNDNGYRSYLLGTQETPKVATRLNLDLSSFLAILLTTWVIQLLLPVMLVQLVYEKEQNLQIMMKMHGLGDTAYWIVNYLYYLTLYVLYILVFIVCGVVADLAIFSRNSYDVLFIFLLLFGNTQIAFSFAISNIFRSNRGCVIFSFLWIFGSGFIGIYMLDSLIPNDATYTYFIELVPPLAAYRGLYELGEYGFRATYANTAGLSWSEFSNDNNHMGYILLVLLFECFFFLTIAWYLEQDLE